MKNMTRGIETLIQFALALLQFVGIFLTKPHMFDRYNHNTPFLAGDPAVYLMLLVSFGSFLLVFLFKDKRYAVFWLTGSLIIALVFSFSLYRYNQKLNDKTFLMPNIASDNFIRVIKGNHYRDELKNACPVLHNNDQALKEQEVIEQCANIRDWSDMDKIWPRDEIIDNTNSLLGSYYLCLFCGGLSLIGFVQTIKCYRSRVS